MRKTLRQTVTSLNANESQDLTFKTVIEAIIARRYIRQIRDDLQTILTGKTLQIKESTHGQ